MSSPPWEPDRTLTREMASALIREQFPAIESDGLTHLGSGWAFDAFLTTDGWVFRFPRRAWCADLLEPEQGVHRLVAEALPPAVAVPRMELVGEPALGFPYRFAGHRFLPGIAADAVEPGLLPILAQEIGAAIGAIHALPESAARAAGVSVPRADDGGGREWLERGRRTAFTLRGLDPGVDRALGWLSEVSWPFPRFDGRLRLIHQDLSPEHVLADPATGHLVGILDWTDAILGDPARDFVFLVTWRGWELAEEVLRSYPHALDPGFRERLRFMARLLSLMWLAMAHERRADLSKFIAGVHHAFVPADRC
ncbi:MAG TPA: phosphotransferase [Gemmatimonadaceae bacterium]|nr:phosphotransferase [Gemmatimonadaceae bacterium]